MAESDAGAAGLTEQLRRLFPDGKWPEFPWKKGTQSVPVDVDVASSLVALIPNWAGDWNDFAPYLRRSGYTPEDLPRVPVKIISAVAAEQAQENMERRASRGLFISAGVGTCTSTFTTFSLESKATDSMQSDVGRPAVRALWDADTVKTASTLSPMRKSILVAMLADAATSDEETCSKETLQEALRAQGRRVGKSFASHSKALRAKGLVNSQECPPYGYWLTESGIKAATFLRDDHKHLSEWYRRWCEEAETPQSKAK